MARYWYILALVFCLLATAAVADDEENSNDDDSAEIHETTDESADETTVDSTVVSRPAWACPDGWTAYVTEDRVSCLWMSNSTKEFSDAATECVERGGVLARVENEDKLEFLKAKAILTEAEYWVGAFKDVGYNKFFKWHSKSPDGIPGFERIREIVVPDILREIATYQYRQASSYISGITEDWESTQGDHDYHYNFFCEKKAECEPGRFGGKCENECHCEGEPCSSSPQLDNLEPLVCSFGCQRGWTGDACQLNKEEADVNYFCVNSPEKGRYVYIRVDTKGVYNDVYGLTAQREHANWCEGTQVQTNGGIQTIEIHVNNVTVQQMVNEECFGEEEDDNLFLWDLAIKEREGVLLDHDITVHIMCDFSTADTLVRQDGHTMGGLESSNNRSHVEIQKETTAEDIHLQLVNAYTGRPVTEAAVGSSVKLQVTYGRREGSILKGLFPYHCVASSPDGRHRRELLDDNGCMRAYSPVQSFEAKGDNILQTPWFSLFTFEGEQEVTFGCSFSLCFNQCIQPAEKCMRRRRRDTRDVEEDPLFTSFSTIRVLPFEEIDTEDTPGFLDTAAKDHAAVPVAPKFPDTPKAPESPDTHDFLDESHEFLEPDTLPVGEKEEAEEILLGDHFYLNPVTGAMFLLLFLIMLLLFTALLCTTQKSFRDIRREIGVKRSYENYLISGVVQEKDKTVLLP